MPRIIRSILILALTVGFFGLAYAADQKTKAPTGEPRMAAEEDAIRKAAAAFTAAFNKKDAKAVAALCSPQCEFVDEKGRELLGKDAIEKRYAEFFHAHPGVRIETSISSITVLGPGVAEEEGATLLRSSRGRLVSRGFYRVVHVKEDGKWLMAAVHEQASPSAASRPKLADVEWLIGAWTAQKDSREVELNFKWIAEKKFMELSYKIQEKGGAVRSGVQIIGPDPVTGELTSWSFYPNGGSGRSRWSRFNDGWLVDSSGRMPDGRRTSSTYMISRLDANRVEWKSVNRRISGKRLKDVASVELKRKAD